MGQSRTYGSRYHFNSYREHRPQELNGGVLKALGLSNAELHWVYPLKGIPREPEGPAFLRSNKAAIDRWKRFWPQKGKQPTWDGVARIVAESQGEWLLFEAKANHPEFSSPPSRAVGAGRKSIEKAIGETKTYLRVHRDFPWLGTYYQYANRLACLYFLNVVAGVPAHLFFTYFYGDAFPDGRACPRNEAEWGSLITACRLTLGLPDNHKLSDRIHNIFLPRLSPANPQAGE